MYRKKEPGGDLILGICSQRVIGWMVSIGIPREGPLQRQARGRTYRIQQYDTSPLVARTLYIFDVPVSTNLSKLRTIHWGWKLCNSVLVSRMEKRGLCCLARGIFYVDPARHGRPCGGGEIWQGNAKQLAKLRGVAYNRSDKVVQYWSPEIPQDTVYNGSRGRMHI